MMKYQLEVLGQTFPLTERSIDVEPASALEGIGYVRQPHSTILKRAEWRNGRWVDHRKRPFDPLPVAWYSLTAALNG